MPVVAAAVDPLVRVTSRTPLATFMSPEQADIGATTPASDIYSLGVLAYWLLTGGEVPFEGGDPATVSAKQMRSEAPRVDIAPGVSREVADVVARALSRNPAARFSTASAFAQALTQAAAAAPDPTAAAVAEAARRRARPQVAINVPAPLAGPHAAEPFKAAAARWTGERWRSVATTKTQRTITVGVIAVAIVAAVLTQFALTGSSILRTPDVTSASSAENWTMNQATRVIPASCRARGRRSPARSPGRSAAKGASRTSRWWWRAWPSGALATAVSWRWMPLPARSYGRIRISVS